MRFCMIQIHIISSSLIYMLLLNVLWVARALLCWNHVTGMYYCILWYSRNHYSWTVLKTYVIALRIPWRIIARGNTWDCGVHSNKLHCYCVRNTWDWELNYHSRQQLWAQGGMSSSASFCCSHHHHHHHCHHHLWLSSCISITTWGHKLFLLCCKGASEKGME